MYPTDAPWPRRWRIASNVYFVVAAAVIIGGLIWAVRISLADPKGPPVVPVCTPNTSAK